MSKDGWPEEKEAFCAVAADIRAATEARPGYPDNIRNPDMAGIDAKRAVGGNILAHAVNTRIMLRKGKAAQRIARVVQSPLCGELEATLEITDGGVTSVSD